MVKHIQLAYARNATFFLRWQWCHGRPVNWLHAAYIFAHYCNEKRAQSLAPAFTHCRRKSTTFSRYVIVCCYLARLGVAPALHSSNSQILAQILAQIHPAHHCRLLSASCAVLQAAPIYKRPAPNKIRVALWILAMPRLPFSAFSSEIFNPQAIPQPARQHDSTTHPVSKARPSGASKPCSTSWLA